MSRVYDITLPIQSNVVVYPGERPPNHSFYSSIDSGDPSNISHLSMGIHTATHVDAPFHFEVGGKTVDQLPVDRFCGRCRVLDLSHIKEGNIERSHLESICCPADETIVIFKTRNSSFLTSDKFQEDYCGIGLSAAEWLVDSRVKTIGIDYLSVEAVGDTEFPVHHLLLTNDVLPIEGLCLEGVPPGSYELICLPLCIVGAEGAPARAFLRTVVE